MATSKQQPAEEPKPQRALLASLLALPNALRAQAARRPRLAPLAALGMLGVLSVVGAAILGKARQSAIKTPQRVEQEVSLAMALEALDDGYYSQAREYANKLRKLTLPEDEAGGPAFVLGVAAVHEADDLWGQEQQHYFLLAARHLEQSRKQMFPPGREAQGLFLLGKSLALAGQYDESRPVLEEALTVENPDTAAVYKLLIQAYSQGKHPDLKKAFEFSDKYLADESLEVVERHSGLLLQARLLWELGELEKCLETCRKIPAEAQCAAEANLLRGRLLMGQAAALEKEHADAPNKELHDHYTAIYRDAIKVLRQAQEDPLDTQSIRRGMYLVGVCLLHAEDTRAALAQFNRARSVYLDTSEGQAAGLQEADLLRSVGQDDDAVAGYCRVLAAMPAVSPYVNPWMPGNEFRNRVLAAVTAYQKSNQFKRAIEISERCGVLMTPEAAVRLTAESYRAWGRQLLGESLVAPEPKATELRKLGRQQARQAGRVFTQLAQLEFSTRRYPDDLWEAADCYLEGHLFSAAGTTLEDYLKHELRRRRPLALVNLGDARLAQGKLDASLEALKECIDFYPQDPACYAARLLISKVYMERNEPDQAEAILRENLNGELLTPESKEWRESLFAYGELLMTQRRYEEAIGRMEEAIQRYPDTREATRLHYMVAEAYREVAKAPQEKLTGDTIETARLAHFKQMQQALEAAIGHYEQLQTALNRRQEKSDLSELENATLRNSYFAVGAALFDMGRYEQAIKAFSIATNRYQHTPEVLQAFVQIATCYRRLNKPLEARGAVEQAKVVLSRISEDADFTQATNYTRGEWTGLLDWLGTL